MSIVTHKALKAAATPFHEERIARPSLEETEPKGVLAPIAARVLMKILFAARMARFDLLRAVQGLAARVTKWSVDCDKALYRLVCYINSTFGSVQSFIGDSIVDGRLWLFADADHAGEYDNRSTSGCFLVLVGPNTYFPLTAFSKKQTSVSMSSTESEVVSANVSLRSVGLPSSGLWLHLQKAGGGVQKSLPKQPSMPGGLPNRFVSTESCAGKKSDYTGHMTQAEDCCVGFTVLLETEDSPRPQKRIVQSLSVGSASLEQPCFAMQKVST